MYHDFREVFWWDGLKGALSNLLQSVPIANKWKPSCFLYKIQVPNWKREDFNTIFVVGLPQNRRQYDSIWVVVDRLNKSTYFMPVKYIYTTEDFARIYIDNIVSLHGVPLFNRIEMHNSHLGFGGHFTKMFRYSSEIKHHFSSLNGWSSIMYHSNSWRYA